MLHRSLRRALRLQLYIYRQTVERKQRVKLHGSCMDEGVGVIRSNARIRAPWRPLTRRDLKLRSNETRHVSGLRGTLYLPASKTNSVGLS
jgi:hypothetical protein